MKELVFSAVGGGGGAAIILAILSWLRNKDADKATVAEKWESGVSTLLSSAQQRVEQLDADLAAMRATAAATRVELVDCQRRCRLISEELDRALVMLEAHGVDTAPFHARLSKESLA